MLEHSCTKMQEEICSSAAELLEAALPGTGLPRLTRREHEVLAGVAEQLSNKEIAAHLHLSERTVKFHVSSLLGKFRVSSRMALVREAFGPALKIGFGTATHREGGFRDRLRFAPDVRSAQIPAATGRERDSSEVQTVASRGLRIVRPEGRHRLQ